MDNQNTLVIGGAIVGMFVIGGFFLSGPDRHDRSRPAYATEDVRYRFQQEDLKKKKKNKKTTRRAPTYATGNSSNAGAVSERSENEEPSVFDHEPQEEPPLD